MRPSALTALAALIAAGVGSAVLAQDQYGYDQNPNVQAYRQEQEQRSVYDYQQDAYARARDTYAQRSADYQAERSAYEHRLARYQRARAAYDAQYGPGAYERFYPVPPPPY
jgi:hypothetical protein